MTKIAVVTGGSRGLGRAAAQHLAAAGTDVVLTYVSARADAEEAVASIEAQGRRALALRLDVGQVASISGFARELGAALSEHFGRKSFDFLINNAGHGVYASIEETTEEQFDSLMNVHFKGVFFLTQKLLPLMEDGGRILNVSTGLTRFSLPGYAAYASMKGAIEVLTRYLAKELGPRRIAVNAVAPGGVATDFGGGALRDDPEVREFIASVTALGRMGQPDDLGALMASLLSEDSRWINAQRVEASGGMFV